MTTSLFILVMSVATGAAPDWSARAVAGRTYRCGHRGFWVKLTFRADGRAFRYANSAQETGVSTVVWRDDGTGRTNDPEDPPLSVDRETGRFGMRGQTCVLDDAP